MSSCIIYLDNYQGRYCPGNTITGKVICSFYTSKSIRGIRLKVRGIEHNNWTKTESVHNSERNETETRTVEYSGNNIFFAVETTLVGQGDLGAGRHEYPFSFHLPKNIPGTFHGQYGWIKYFIKATVDRPYKFDYDNEKELNIEAPIDLNEIRNELQLTPVAYSDDKTLCCCCCANGLITMNVHLEKEAFIIGETAKVRVEITNMANESVEGIRVEICTIVVSKVTTPSSDSKSDHELLAASNDTGVGAHGERVYEFKLEIPRSARVPNFNLCTLFSQWSILKVTAVLPSCHTNMTISTSIVVGHIPVRGAERFQNTIFQQNANAVPSYPPPQFEQVPVGGIPYPPTSYPPGSEPPPYPSVSPSNCAVGFNVPQPTSLPASKEFSTLPSGALPSAAGPSAPPMDDVASAPSKAQLSEGGEGDFVVVGANKPSGDGGTNELPPPSYNEAIHSNRNINSAKKCS